MNKQEIIEYYNTACQLLGKQLTRADYRKLTPVYSSSLIEKIWGSWGDFVKEAETVLALSRTERTRQFDKGADKIVLTYMPDGSTLDLDAFKILQSYCKENKAKLGILWGRAIHKEDVFSMETYDLLKDYLATKFVFAKDSSCIAQDFLIPFTQKNPLLNLDKISTSLHTIIAGSTKQYLKIFPYKQYNTYRIGASTGTISKIDYKMTSSGFIDVKFHTQGGLFLEWSTKEKRYIIRNLVIKDNCLYDLNKQYTPENIKTINSVPAMVLGDLHFPEQDDDSIKKTHDQLSLLKPEHVAMGDWCSYNSINHHTMNQALTKIKNRSEKDYTLKIELENAKLQLESLVKKHMKTMFHVVYSNHDRFLTTFLNDGLFVKDVDNAEMGCELFLKILRNQSLLDTPLKNVHFMTEFDELEIKGVDLSNHGHIGIAGMRGNPKTYTRICDKAVVGHTHSPALEGSVVVVGTNSKLKLNYTSNISNWAFANAVVHENGTIQLLLT